MEIRRPGNVVLVCGMFCVFGAGLLLASRGTRELPAGEAISRRLPREIGEWVRTRNVRYGEQVFRILGTKEVSGAVYRNGRNDTVYLVLVSATNNRSAFHPPEYCMEGSGFEMRERRRVRADPGGTEVNELRFARRAGEDVLVWNWYASGTEMTSSFYRQQAALFVARVRTGRSRGTAVTLYTHLAAGDLARARQATIDFTRSLEPFLKTYLAGEVTTNEGRKEW